MKRSKKINAPFQPDARAVVPTGPCYCPYCSHEYMPARFNAAAYVDALKLHIAECPQHPMHRLLEVLKSGRDLVASTVAHVSHGGPTRADAAAWLKEANAAIAAAELVKPKKAAKRSDKNK